MAALSKLKREGSSAMQARTHVHTLMALHMSSSSSAPVHAHTFRCKCSDTQLKPPKAAKASIDRSFCRRHPHVLFLKHRMLVAHMFCFWHQWLRRQESTQRHEASLPNTHICKYLHKRTTLSPYRTTLHRTAPYCTVPHHTAPCRARKARLHTSIHTSVLMSIHMHTYAHVCAHAPCSAFTRCFMFIALHHTAPHRTAPLRTAPHRSAPRMFRQWQKNEQDDGGCR